MTRRHMIGQIKNLRDHAMSSDFQLQVLQSNPTTVIVTYLQ